MISLTMMLGSLVFLNGWELNAKCRSRNATEQGICGGYIIGVSDTFNKLLSMKVIKSVICLPTSATQIQIIDATVKYIRDNADTVGSDASVVVSAELRCHFTKYT
ncbi:Rap1a/Tai family immunity protein [Sphingomonas asaccharolytica]|uniref:Rap1a/Tai family immunity protein n=1 Tax=Sphingomonas asaccharolytica TaxID=40681 RepID=UPI0008303E77|nr:Rap1a/Tai family immunity protein [Sphingomonas asaccharolytica]